MKKKLLDILACPSCKRSLACNIQVEVSDDVLEGTLNCASCVKEYPISGGIPRFVPHQNYASSFGFQWNHFREQQLDSVTGHTQSADRFYAETTWTKDWLEGKWILDAGSGAGRFLEVASRSNCDVVGVDITNAVDAAQKTLQGRPNVHLVQASIFDLPFRPGVFDGVYSIGVIQHTPDPSRALRALPGLLKPGGRLALTIYERRRFTLLNGKYLIRPLTRRIPDRLLLLGLKLLMPVLFPLTEVLFRIPLLERLSKFAIPVANYTDDPQLSLRQRYQWALMDTFDMLAPQFDNPQREPDVRKVLEDAGVGEVKRLKHSGLNLIGVRKTHAPAEGAAHSVR